MYVCMYVCMYVYVYYYIEVFFLDATNKPTVLLTYPDIFSPHDGPSH